MPLNDVIGGIRRLSRAVPVFVTVVLVSGCAVGPRFRAPAPPALSSYTRPSLSATTTSSDIPGGEQQRFVSHRDVPGEWWTLFGSPSLNALITNGLSANSTLVAAQAALRQARELCFAG